MSEKSYIQRQREERASFEQRRKSSGRTREEQRAVDNSNSAQAVQERREAATQERADRLRDKGASQAAIDATGANERITITQPSRDAQGRTAIDAMIEQNAQDRRARALAEFTVQQTMDLRRRSLFTQELRAQQIAREQLAAQRRDRLAQAQADLDNARRGPLTRLVLASPLARAPTAEELVAGGALTPGGFTELKPSSEVLKQTVIIGGLSDVTAPIARIPSQFSKLLPSRFRIDTPDININAPQGTKIGTGIFPDADTTLIQIQGKNPRGENVLGFIRQTSGDTLQTPRFTSGVNNPQGQVAEFVVGRRRVVITDVPQNKITFEPNAALTQKVGVDIFTPESSTVINRNVQIFRQRNGVFGDGKLLRSFDTIEKPAPGFTETSLFKNNKLLNVVEDAQQGFSVAGSRREQAFRLTGSNDDLTISGVRVVREDAISQASFEKTSATLRSDKNIVADGPAVFRKTGEFRDSKAPEFVFDDVPKLKDTFEISKQSIGGGELKFVAETKAPRIVTRGETSIGGGFDIISGTPPKNPSKLFESPTPPESRVIFGDTTAKILTEGKQTVVSRFDGETYLKIVPSAKVQTLRPGTDFGLTTPKVLTPTNTVGRSGAIAQQTAQTQRGLQLVSLPDATPPTPLGSAGRDLPKVQIKPTSGFASAATPRTIRTDLLTTDLSEFANVRPAAPILDQPSAFEFQTGSASLRNNDARPTFQPQITTLKPIVKLETPTIGAQEFTPIIDSNLDRGTRSRNRSGTRSTQTQQPSQAIDTITTPVTIQNPQLGLTTGGRISEPPFKPFDGGFGGFRRTPPPQILFAPPGLPRLPQSFKPQGFRALVKVGGTFKAFGPVLSRAEALEFGARKVAQTPSASFKIASAGRAPETKLGIKGFFRGFGRSKKDEDVFVEPNKLRINTPGELRGITFKGIQSSRFKKVF